MMTFNVHKLKETLSMDWTKGIVIGMTIIACIIFLIFVGKKYLK